MNHDELLQRFAKFILVQLRAPEPVLDAVIEKVGMEAATAKLVEILRLDLKEMTSDGVIFTAQTCQIECWLVNLRAAYWREVLEYAVSSGIMSVLLDEKGQLLFKPAHPEKCGWINLFAGLTEKGGAVDGHHESKMGS